MGPGKFIGFWAVALVDIALAAIFLVASAMTADGVSEAIGAADAGAAGGVMALASTGWGAAIG